MNCIRFIKRVSEKKSKMNEIGAVAATVQDADGNCQKKYIGRSTTGNAILTGVISDRELYIPRSKTVVSWEIR